MVSSLNINYTTQNKLRNSAECIRPNKNNSVIDALLVKRNKSLREATTQDHIKAGFGAALGCALPMLYFMKKQKVSNPFKIEYGLKEMVALSATSIIGGVGAGVLGEDQESNKNKLKEGIFQFLNASIPAWVVGGSLKLCESSKNYNNIPGKILAMLGGLLIGMYGAASLANVICDPQDRVPDRKLTLLDCIVNIDDLVGVLVLAKFPLIGNLHLDRILPFIYAYCGYRAGKSN